MPPPPANAAFFIDFDGTLVALAERPDLVVVEPEVLALLECLTRRFDGAVAVITGRSLDTIDRFLSPLKLPVAAEYGLMRRDGAGLVHGDAQSADAVALVAAKLEPLVSGHEGLLLERKIGSVALHYRARPELEKLCAEAVAEAVVSALGDPERYRRMSAASFKASEAYTLERWCDRLRSALESAWGPLQSEAASGRAADRRPGGAVAS